MRGGARRWSLKWMVGFVIGALVAGACRRTAVDGTPIYTPFNQRKPVAVLRSSLDGNGIHIDVGSSMQGRLALRFDTIELFDGGGLVVQRRPPPRTCLLAGESRATIREPGPNAQVAGRTQRIVAAAVAIPLDNPGRSMYREWAWLRRPHEIAEIDAELARLDALPRCGG